MSSMPASTVKNQLVESLPPRQREALLSCCTIQQLSLGELLSSENTRIDYVYFPLTAFISQTSSIDSRKLLEMGMIGNEGMLGATLALGVGVNPMRAIVQGGGTSLRVSVQQFSALLEGSLDLQQTCQLYLYVLMEQLAKSAACNHFHSVKPRLARWLLMCDDRAHGQTLNLTHRFLSGVLGVQRSAITIAAHGLQTKSIITYKRGKVAILSRPRLEQMSCGCYEALLLCYRRQFAP